MRRMISLDGGTAAGPETQEQMLCPTDSAMEPLQYTIICFLNPI